MKPKSIFDGWTKKIEHRAYDNEGGFCASGWLVSIEQWKFDNYTRIGTWIQHNLNPPDSYIHQRYGHRIYPKRDAAGAIIWANNECKLDIEGFRMVDLLTSGYVPEDCQQNASSPEITEEKVEEPIEA